MDKAEAAAKSIVENLIAGARMHYRESQSLGEHDFDLEYPTGMRVPLEVTVATDAAAEATRAAVLRSHRGGPFVSRIYCARDWEVHPRRHANINKIRARIDRCLAAIEAEGKEQFNAFTDSARSPAVRTILQELGIEYGKVVRWKSPGIGIMMPGDGGRVDPALVNEAVETEAFKADNKRKLNAVVGSEKHLFVYVNQTRHVVWVAVSEEAPPAEGPKLPPEMTHVWVATWAGEGAWHTVWQALRGFSWTYMGQVNIETGEVKAG